MKRKTILTFAAMALACAAFADSVTITNVIVRQRWPWSGVVDIDFTVKGGSTGVKFLARCEGMEEFQLAEKDLIGDFDAVFEPGEHSMAWDPARAGFGNRELKGFSVTVLPEDRTYLILNLYDGSYRYAASEPAGGWLADPANYSTNIVFRRIPAGTKNLGLPNDLRDLVGFTAAYSKTHAVTLSSDYYIGVFMVTGSQNTYAAARGKGTMPAASYSASRERNKLTYDALRGSKETDEIDWPNTEYAVSAESRVASYRNITANTFPKEWIIDLPTVAQWEYAARATTPDDQLWSVGGKSSDSLETITNLIDQIAVWSHNVGNDGITATVIGQRSPNGWGLYDMVGLQFEWNLDWYGSLGNYSGLNPVGPKSNSDNRRARRSMYTSPPSGLSYLTTAMMGYKPPAGDSYGYRLCIHLKSLFK